MDELKAKILKLSAVYESRSLLMEDVAHLVMQLLDLDDEVVRTDGNDCSCCQSFGYRIVDKAKT